MAAMADLDVLVIDCLREQPHVSHFHLDATLDAIATLKPKRAILTDLHIDLDYVQLSKCLPETVEAAFDGMEIAIDG